MQNRPNRTTRLAKTAKLRDFIVKNVSEHPRDIARLVESKFDISRQAAVGRLRQLVDEGILTAAGKTKARLYALQDFVEEVFEVPLTDLAEGDVWQEIVSLSLLKGLPPNVVDICQYGLTEMLNNAIDHSGAPEAIIMVNRNALNTVISVDDHGIGIFNKIQADFGLSDPRHALLELSKGKLTSDPAAHTGEGIFFTSRMFDEFNLWSGTLVFSRKKEGQDWLVEVTEKESQPGTFVEMKISNDSDLTVKEVFDSFAPGSDDYGFSKTIVPVRLAQYEGEKLISRSQAKRLVARFDRFQEVVLDFQGVIEIGQAFADEVFRVYSRSHPEVALHSTNTTPAVEQMIRRAQSN